MAISADRINQVQLESKIASLEQLIEVYENSVIEQTEKLYQEIEERKRLAAELEKHDVSQAISQTLNLKALGFNAPRYRSLQTL